MYIQLRPSLGNTLLETNIAPENRPSPPNPQISGAMLVLGSVKADEMLMIPSVSTSMLRSSWKFRKVTGEVGKCHLFPSEDVVHGMPWKGSS